MGLEFAASFNDVGASLVIDQSGKGRHLDLSSFNASQVAGGHDRGALGKTGATMPVLPAAVLAASQTDDRCIMVDYQSDLTTWIVRFDDPTFGSGMWGLLNLGSPNAVQGQVRDNAGGHNLMTRPSAAAPGAAWHNYALVYIRATGVCSIYRDGVFVISQSFTAGTQLSTSATAINIAEWTTAGPSLDNLRIFSHAPRPDEILALANTPVMPDSPTAVLTASVLGPGLFTRPWLGAGTDVASSSSQSGTLAVTGTAAVGLAGTRDQPSALAIGGVAAVGLAATREQFATFPAAGVASVGLAGVVERPAALSVLATASVSLGATREVPATLAVTGAAAVSLAGLLDQHATLPVLGTAAVGLAAVRSTTGNLNVAGQAQVALSGTLDQQAALGATGAAVVGLLATRTTGGTLAVAGTAVVGLDTLGGVAGSLAVTGAAAVGLVATREASGLLTVTGAGSLILVGERQQPGQLLVAGAAMVGLGALVDAPALLVVQALAAVTLAGARQVSAVLAILGTADVGLSAAGSGDEVPGSLLLQVGEGRPVGWLVPSEPGAVVVVDAGAPTPSSWLSSGAGRPA